MREQIEANACPCDHPHPSGSTVSRLAPQFTTSRGSILDGKRFFQADTSPVLTRRLKTCSLVTSFTSLA